MQRWITSENEIQIRGFCDAAEPAYSACVYIRSVVNGYTEMNLITAKTKASPIEKQTIPRLELSGAVLLAKLTKKVLKDMDINVFYGAIRKSLWLGLKVMKKI